MQLQMANFNDYSQIVLSSNKALRVGLLTSPE